MAFSTSHWLLLIFLLAVSTWAHAEELINTPRYWIQRAVAAARTLSYEGTFVLQQDNQVQSSSIQHLASSEGVYERVETLDQAPVIVIRTPEITQVYKLNTKTTYVQPRTPAQPIFAAAPAARFQALSRWYGISLGPRDRYAGRECQEIIFLPRDAYRFGQTMCVEVDSGLVIRSSLLNQRKEAVETLTYTAINFAPHLARSMFVMAPTKIAGFKVIRSTFQSMPTISRPQRKEALPGFRMVSAALRYFPEHHETVKHYMFSDGLASVSAFLEPLGQRSMDKRNGMMRRGGTGIFSETAGSYRITVIGEIPDTSLQQVASAIDSQPPPKIFHQPAKPD